MIVVINSMGCTTSFDDRAKALAWIARQSFPREWFMRYETALKAKDGLR